MSETRSYIADFSYDYSIPVRCLSAAHKGRNNERESSIIQKETGGYFT